MSSSEQRHLTVSPCGPPNSVASLAVGRPLNWGVSAQGNNDGGDNVLIRWVSPRGFQTRTLPIIWMILPNLLHSGHSARLMSGSSRE